MKYLKFLLLAMMFTIMFSVPTYADEQHLFDLPDFSHLVDEDEHYVIEVYNSDKDISEWQVILRVLENTYITWSTSDRRYNYKEGSYDYICKQGYTEWVPDGFTSNPAFNTNFIHYSCCDLIKYDSNEVFFHRAPIKSVGAIQISLFQMRKALKQVDFLIPCLIGLLISLVAFRKSWNWLKTRLSEL